MIKNVSEFSQGDGGYIMDQEGDILPIEDWADPSEIDTSEELSIIDIEAESENTQQDRIDFVRTNYGFYPKSAEELSSIIGIDGTPGRDAARRMAVIMRRQHKLRDGGEAGEELARRTAFEIARQYIDYRKEARGTATFLKIIFDDAMDAMSNGRNVADLMLDAQGGERRAVANVIRSIELAEFVRGEETDRTFDFGTNTEFMQRAELHILDRDNDSLRSDIDRALEEERRRLNFWHEKVKQLGRVTVLAEMANRAIGNY